MKTTETKQPQLYAVEFTDTFGGEANYCWRQNFRVWARDIRQAITRAKQHRYNSPLPPHRASINGSDSARIDLKGAAICAFIEWTDPDAPTATQEFHGEITNPEQAPPEHRPQWWEQSTSLGLIQLELTPAQAIEATPAGQDAQPYITALINRPEIAAQLDAMPAGTFALGPDGAGRTIVHPVFPRKTDTLEHSTSIMVMPADSRELCAEYRCLWDTSIEPTHYLLEQWTWSLVCHVSLGRVLPRSLAWSKLWGMPPPPHVLIEHPHGPRKWVGVDIMPNGSDQPRP